MIRYIEAKQKVKYEEYWVMRGVHEENGKKVVIDEEEYKVLPTQQDIVDFLLRRDCLVDFVSVEHNYRLIKE